MAELLHDEFTWKSGPYIEEFYGLPEAREV